MSETTNTPSSQQNPGTPDSPTGTQETNPELSVKGLQTKEHAKILAVIQQVRKHGLEGELALPQIVVCGDQSSGKSSLLAAITGLQLPRSDNMCTRYATEINLKSGTDFSVSVKIIPDSDRTLAQQNSIKAFHKQITDLNELPKVMEEAMVIMGITTSAPAPNLFDNAGNSTFRAISKDVLSLDIEDPNQVQLTLVDIPGLIATDTKTATTVDVEAISDITDKYISQSRTIVLAVVSAAHDYANQRILKRVREADPDGVRSLGIITKPDRVEGRGSQSAFLELARNEDIKFKLGWHVVMNRNADGENLSIEQQKQAEMNWFRRDFMKVLLTNIVGVDSLRNRLSLLLFEHVKRELPKLRDELEAALEETKDDLARLGACRSTPAECKSYLEKICFDYQAICKAALDGHYEGAYFRGPSSSSLVSNRRARAVVQDLNAKFSDDIRKNGHKYFIDKSLQDSAPPVTEERVAEILDVEKKDQPMKLSRKEAIAWARHFMVGTRGRELLGNFNPLLVGELFFDQSINWKTFARAHVNKMYVSCSNFLLELLQNKCPEDVQGRIWDYMKGELRKRKTNADEELNKLIRDLESYPINYNHYYTENVHTKRHERQKAALAKSIEQATTTNSIYTHQKTYEASKTINVEKALKAYTQETEPDMEDFASWEALECLIAIYKVLLKVFVANVTTQVIERHIVRGLEDIFAPKFLGRLTEKDCQNLAAEPLDVQRERDRLVNRIAKLEGGYEAFREVMGVRLD